MLSNRKADSAAGAARVLAKKDEKKMMGIFNRKTKPKEVRSIFAKGKARRAKRRKKMADIFGKKNSMSKKKLAGVFGKAGKLKKAILDVEKSISKKGQGSSKSKKSKSNKSKKTKVSNRKEEKKGTGKKKEEKEAGPEAEAVREEPRGGRGRPPEEEEIAFRDPPISMDSPYLRDRRRGKRRSNKNDKKGLSKYQERAKHGFNAVRERKRIFKAIAEHRKREFGFLPLTEKKDIVVKAPTRPPRKGEGRAVVAKSGKGGGGKTRRDGRTPAEGLLLANRRGEGAGRGAADYSSYGDRKAAAGGGGVWSNDRFQSEILAGRKGGRGGGGDQEREEQDWGFPAAGAVRGAQGGGPGPTHKGIVLNVEQKFVTKVPAGGPADRAGGRGAGGGGEHLVNVPGDLDGGPEVDLRYGEGAAGVLNPHFRFLEDRQAAEVPLLQNQKAKIMVNLGVRAAMTQEEI